MRPLSLRFPPADTDPDTAGVQGIRLSWSFAIDAQTATTG